ncbi:hypothetical protein M427DRAFT_93424 [Gonapodya prolifera JEL478]|uniref:DNA-directed RNA polymerase III subunit RPC3 n=1 Tax=Gonapodya prolifera (strain JEL478) TaxID=1344416 RepID=A0A139AYK5_GONPJ|nr:hypothetical protein M427DRAFT_93424 [Gonapodya prolifera JEL478]|eukprot:KXS21643.1 hypothetical protein M427DRAFT_93424 [Gonapodya prolifera JEL478]
MTARARLAAEILKDAFGPIVQKVGNTLIIKGRLTIGALAQNTKLPVRQIREALFSLIQHNLVRWIEAVEGQRVVTHYSLETEDVLARLRLPSHVALVKKLLGGDAGAVMEFVAKYGRIKNPHPNWDDPTLVGHEPTELQKAWTKLATSRILICVTHIDSTSMVDRLLVGEAEGVRTSLMPTANEKKKAKAEAEAKAQEERYGSDSHIGAYMYVLFHCQEVAELASIRLNKAAAQIAGGMMHNVTEEVRGCKFEQTSREFPSVPIPDTLDLPIVPTPGVHRAPLHEYMELLADDECRFVERTDSGMGGRQYVVNFREVSATLRRVLIERVVENRFGHASLRVFRLLRHHGKLEDKQAIIIAKIAMLRDKEVRTRLYELFNGGFVQSQEVPRGADRSAQKTFFLWFVDLDRARDSLRSYIIQTCTKLMQRHQHERFTHHLLLEKLEREDVGGDPSKLPESEEATYNVLERSLGMLDAAILRLENMRMILEDF